MIIAHQEMAAVRKQGKLIFYILLNILISAGTVFLVLVVWDKTHPLPELNKSLPEGVDLISPADQQEDLSSEQMKILPEEDIRFVIEGVFAVGMDGMEYVLIKNESQGGVSLLGWQVENAKGEAYTFPDLTLNANGRVKLFTGQGTNSVIELYWGMPEAVWHTSDTVILLDSKGIERAVYKIP